MDAGRESQHDRRHQPGYRLFKRHGQVTGNSAAFGFHPDFAVSPLSI